MSQENGCRADGCMQPLTSRAKSKNHGRKPTRKGALFKLAHYPVPGRNFKKDLQGKLAASLTVQLASEVSLE